MTHEKKRRDSIKPKSRIKSTKKSRKSVDEKNLERLIKEYLYRNAEQALSSEITPNIEIQSVENAKNATLKELESIVENQTAGIIKELKQKGISKLTDVNEQPDIVVDMLSKIQTRMEENAKKLSKK